MYNLGKLYERKKIIDDRLDYLFSCNISKKRLNDLEEALFELTDENYVTKMQNVILNGGETMATRRWQLNKRNKEFIEEGIVIYNTLIKR